MLKITSFIIITIFCLSLFFPNLYATAGCCGCDPVYDRDWNGEVITSAYVRDIACMDGSSILTTVGKGSVIKIIAETDGWYKVQLSNVTIGWVGQTLMQVTSKTSSDIQRNNSSFSDLEHLQGYIFLQVEQNWEAYYYYYPEDNKSYYLGRLNDAFNIMRKLGLGATHDYISSYIYYPDNVVGKILLDVEKKRSILYLPKRQKA